ncbi:beta-lactamase hydrolase domain-containing protein [Aliikangiella coralliicola]|uniref:Serine/threonine protein phosphatase n=1 Tax=Aliikangiella coralliicola TaxID=2592383 RepID=A0A545U4X7_9GAMM|nr:sulfur transferase domain-containing protein [Aliikangiella coralliicola]TQV84525.1 serine/threonine protein phosphatase [Aliikangiella coralliicola]
MKQASIYSSLFRLVLLLSFFSLNNASAENQVNLSDISMKNAKIFNGKLITGGQPSAEDLAKLKAMGVNNVINLRTEGEFNQFDESEQTKLLGLNYTSLEISGATGITFENANKLDKILSSHQGMTLIHCASSNRVGALIALRAYGVQHKSLKEAIADGQKAGLKSLKEKVVKLINQREQ